MRTVYFVIGPASSGTRFTSRLLLQYGMHGSAGHIQEFQDFIGPPIIKDKFIEYCNDKQDLLIRLSHPHGYDDPSPMEWISLLLEAGFDHVNVIIVSRNIWGTTMSHMFNGFVENNEQYSMIEHHDIVYDKVLRALGEIWSSVLSFKDNTRVNIVPLHLGDIIANPIVVYRLFCKKLNLNHQLLTDNDILNLVNSDVDVIRFNQYFNQWGA